MGWRVDVVQVAGGLPYLVDAALEKALTTCTCTTLYRPSRAAVRLKSVFEHCFTDEMQL
jgi:hypothetical protein